jgi:antitoxin CptB
MGDAEMSRLRWRCRRGMRELDMLLLGYADRHYAAATAAQQEAFRRLLTLPDPEILALLTGRSEAQDDVLGNLVRQLLEHD